MRRRSSSACVLLGCIQLGVVRQLREALTEAQLAVATTAAEKRPAVRRCRTSTPPTLGSDACSSPETVAGSLKPPHRVAIRARRRAPAQVERRSAGPGLDFSSTSSTQVGGDRLRAPQELVERLVGARCRRRAARRDRRRRLLVDEVDRDAGRASRRWRASRSWHHPAVLGQDRAVDVQAARGARSMSGLLKICGQLTDTRTSGPTPQAVEELRVVDIGDRVARDAAPRAYGRRSTAAGLGAAARRTIPTVSRKPKVRK